MCRGFPVWLKYVPGISFRTDNEPFKVIISSLISLPCFYSIESSTRNLGRDRNSWIIVFRLTTLTIYLCCCRGKCKDSQKRLWDWWRVKICLSPRVGPSYCLRYKLLRFLVFPLRIMVSFQSCKYVKHWILLGYVRILSSANCFVDFYEL